MVAIIIGILALVIAVVSLLVSIKKQSVKVIKETTTVIEHAPVENPFYYDEKKKVYTLDGSLKVNGGISCLELTNNNK